MNKMQTQLVSFLDAAIHNKKVEIDKNENIQWEDLIEESKAHKIEALIYSVIKNNSKYYLMYSSNYWASSDYNVSYVVSDSPLGPFKRPEGSNVLLNSTENSIGPGHNSVFKSPTGELYTVYHIKDITSTKSTWERSLAFDRLGFIGDKLFVNGPTYSSVQSLPSGINNYNIVKYLPGSTNFL